MSPEVLGGLYIPRESIIDPFLSVVAVAENAVMNGARFLLSTQVIGMEKEDGEITVVHTTAGDIRAKYVVNAAGLHCDDIAEMVGKNDYYVNPRKGQFYILDNNTSCKVNHIVLPIPTKLTKGKLMCPTIHGNMLVGPTAEDLTDKTDKAITTEGLASIKADVEKLIPRVQLRDTITQYAGLRANRNPEGLNIDVYDDIKNYVNLSGVRSTGLTASVSIGTYVVEMLKGIGLALTFKENVITKRRGIPLFRELSRAEQDELIRENPLYGNIVCRCETVTEGQIVDAIHSVIPARSMDAIKRRVRAGMGRCQGGFCGPKVIEIIARELGVDAESVCKRNKEAYMIASKVK